MLNQLNGMMAKIEKQSYFKNAKRYSYYFKTFFKTDVIRKHKADYLDHYDRLLLSHDQLYRGLSVNNLFVWSVFISLIRFNQINTQWYFLIGLNITLSALVIS